MKSMAKINAVGLVISVYLQALVSFCLSCDSVYNRFVFEELKYLKV